mgnify:CR=1 FL=1
MSLINTQVLPFKTQAYLNGKFIDVSDETLKGCLLYTSPSPRDS